MNIPSLKKVLSCFLAACMILLPLTSAFMADASGQPQLRQLGTQEAWELFESLKEHDENTAQLLEQALRIQGMEEWDQSSAALTDGEPALGEGIAEENLLSDRELRHKSDLSGRTRNYLLPRDPMAFMVDQAAWQAVGRGEFHAGDLKYAHDEDQPIRTDRFIVRYKDSAWEEAQVLLAKVGWHSLPIGGSLSRDDEQGLALLVVNKSVLPSVFAQELKALGFDAFIHYIQPDYFLELYADGPDGGLGEAVEPDGNEGEDSDADGQSDEGADDSGAPAEVAPVDNVELDGQLSEKPAADEAPLIRERDRALGGATPTVALIDTAVDRESGGDEATQHGTLLTDVMTGVAGEQDETIEILALPVFEQGKARTSDVLEAILYAEEQGADVVNLSFGSAYENPALYEVIAGSPMLFIAAAGNNFSDLAGDSVYPAAYRMDNLITAGASDDAGRIAPFSNYSGRYVDIAATGYVEANSAMNGTSVSAARVSAAAAVLLAREVMEAHEVKGVILDSADRITDLENYIADGRRLNLEAALAGESGQELRASNTLYNDHLRTDEERWELFAEAEIDAIYTGQTRTYAVTTDGIVWVWGEANYSGLSSVSGSLYSPHRIDGLSSVVKIEVGTNVTFALKSDGTVWTWGMRLNGVLGLGENAASQKVPVPIPGLDNIADITMRDSHCYAVRSDGTLWAWGFNNKYGHLGVDTGEMTIYTPTHVAGIEDVVMVMAGSFASIAVTRDQSLWAWGQTSIYAGQPDTPYPVKMSIDLGEIVAMEAGTHNHVVLNRDGEVWNMGSFSSASKQFRKIPFSVPAVAIVGSGNFSGALLEDGSVWTWGTNSYGELGYETSEYISYTPQQVSIDEPIESISGAYRHVVCKTESGNLWVWGMNGNAQLGDGTTDHRTDPYKIVLRGDEETGPYNDHLRTDEERWALFQQSEIISLATSNHQTFAVASNGVVWVWGTRLYSGITQSTANYLRSPHRIDGLSDVVKVSSSSNAFSNQHTHMALRADGTVWIWGRSAYGALGLGKDITQVLTPVQLSELYDMVDIIAGDRNSYAIDSDGSVWVWGNNTTGSLGIVNGSSAVYTPVLLGDNKDIKGKVARVGTGNAVTFVLDRDNALWYSGQGSDVIDSLRDRTLTKIDAIVLNAVGNITNIWASSHYLIVQNDAGELWRIGDIIDNTTSFERLEYPGILVDVQAGTGHVAALLEDGTVWTWGKSYSYGQLGYHALGPNLDPEQVRIPERIAAIATKGDHTVALAESGNIWAWGDNSRGQLGDGTYINMKRPILVSEKQPFVPNYDTLFVAPGLNINKELAARAVEDHLARSWAVDLYGIVAVGPSARYQIDIAMAGESIPFMILDETGELASTDGYYALQSERKYAMVAINESGVEPGSTFTISVTSETVYPQANMDISNANMMILQPDGHITSWGSDSLLLGDGDSKSNPKHRVVQVQVPSRVRSISSGYQHNLALDQDGIVWAWGYNNNAQIQYNGPSGYSAPTPVEGLPQIEAIYTGGWYSIAIDIEGRLWAWGNNTQGELGDIDIGTRSAPILIEGFDNPAAVAAGRQHILVLKRDGTVWGWGYNYHKAIDFSDERSCQPKQLDHLSDIVAIEAGEKLNLALTSDGKVWSWGSSYLGIGSNAASTHKNTAVMPDVERVVQFSTDADTTFVRTLEGETFVWGSNDNGYAGVGRTDLSLDYPEPLTLIGVLKQIHYKNQAAMATDSDDTLWAWGKNSYYRVHPNDTSNKFEPYRVPYQFDDYASSIDRVDDLHTLDSDGLIFEGSIDFPHDLDYFGVVSQTKTSVFLRLEGDSQDLELAVYDGEGERLNVTDTLTMKAGATYYIEVAGDAKTYVEPIDYRLSIEGDETPPVIPPEPDRPIRLAAGNQHSVLVDGTGQVYTWGANSLGQLGDGSVSNRYKPMIIDGIDDVIAVSSAPTGQHTLALRGDGSVWAWGSNANGRLGDGTTTDRTSPVQVKNLSDVIGIAAGVSHNLALTADGRVWAWGTQNAGQLGHGVTSAQTRPVLIPDLDGVTAVAAGNNSSYALRADGSVWSWGANQNGQLGDGGTANRNTPKPISGIGAAKAINAGFNFVHAIQRDGSVMAWGLNNQGQLGVGNTANSSVPVSVEGLEGIIDIAGRTFGGLALSRDGQVYGWGLNTNGQVGDGTVTRRLMPTHIDTLSDVTVIALGNNHGLALDREGKLWSWGSNDAGQLGEDSAGYRTLPGLVDIDLSLPTPGEDDHPDNPENAVVHIMDQGGEVKFTGRIDHPEDIDWFALSAEQPMRVFMSADVCDVHTAVKLFDSDLSPIEGEVGHIGPDSILYIRAYWQGDDAFKVIPYSITIRPAMVAPVHRQEIAAGGAHTLAIGERGELWVWGDNRSGQLGLADREDRWMPTRLAGLSDVSYVTAGHAHTFAMTENGAVWSFGDNTYGQAGHPASGPIADPRLLDITDVVKIAAGAQHSLLLRHDGTVWIAGAFGTVQSSEAFSQVLLLGDIVDIAVGDHHNMALRADGTVWSWGANNEGQLGDGTINHRLEPQRIEALTGIASLYAYGSYSVACDLEGKLFTWGDNSSGQLGDGSTCKRTVPQSVAGISPVRWVAPGEEHVVVIDDQGMTWIWGGDALGTSHTLVPEMWDDLSDLAGIASGANHAVARAQNDLIYTWGASDSGQLGNNLVQGSTQALPVFHPADDHPNLPSMAEVISLGKSMYFEGAIDYLGDVDWFAFTPVCNGSFAVTVDTLTDDSDYTWFDDNLDVLVLEGDALNLQANQTYYLKVGSGDQLWHEAIAYSLSLTDIATEDIAVQEIVAAHAGEQYRYQLVGTSLESPGAVRFVLTYDSTVLTLANLTAQDGYGQSWDRGGVTIIEQREGRVVFSFDCPVEEGRVWTGLITLLDFEAIASVETTVLVDTGSSIAQLMSIHDDQNQDSLGDIA